MATAKKATKPIEAPDGVKIVPSGAATPILYADTAISVSFGVYTSKVHFGLEQEPNKAAPAFTLVVPTGSLRALAQGILAQIDAPDTQAQMREQFEVGLTGSAPKK